MKRFTSLGREAACPEVGLHLKRKLWLLFAAFACATAACGAEKDRHVVVISLDGFPAYLWHRPDLPVPNLRRLAAAGASAEAMTVTNPSSTWSSHTSMITGRSPRYHGVFFNGQVVLKGPRQMPVIEQWADKDGFVLVPTLYDIAHEAGLTTAESDWVAITRAKTIDWSFPEIPRVDGKVEQEMIAAGLLTAEQIGWMEHKPGRKSLVWHDETWAKAANFIFEQHRPNLLLFHPLTTDWVHHHYGPGTEASYVALAFADRLVGELVDTVERTGLRDRTTFIVMTDHGFKKVTHSIHANVALRNAGLARSVGPNLVDCDAAVMSLGGTAMVYITDPARKAELLPKLKALLAATEGIAQVIDGSDGPTLGLPTPQENARMGDLFLVAADGYLFENSAAAPDVVMPVGNYAATHGYLASDPETDGIFIASGAHIKAGVTLPRVSNLDIAPTLARLLGLSLPGAEGRVLEKILDEDAAPPAARVR
ncbi:MAG TPA: alkaline phosphatase family protein [Opitutus sp.]|nr:alkaline phosphatase family protein [Opitutus sp.]